MRVLLRVRDACFDILCMLGWGSSAGSCRNSNNNTGSATKQQSPATREAFGQHMRVMRSNHASMKDSLAPAGTGDTTQQAPATRDNLSQCV